jgi:hypothetical protein
MEIENKSKNIKNVKKRNKQSNRINFYINKKQTLEDVNLLSSKFNGANPYEVTINGTIKTDCIKNCYLNADETNISMKFNSQFSSRNNMFYGLTKIIEIDLLNFNF